MRALRGILLFVFSMSIMFFPGPSTRPATAQVEAVLGVTLGVFLSGALDKINGSISRAREAGRSTIIDAGQQASWTISKMQAAYKDMLDTTVRQLDKSVKEAVANVETMLLELERNTDEDARDAMAKATEIANMLPLSKNFPQLTKQSPKLLAPSLGGRTRITLSGNFVDASEEGYEPTLYIGEKVFRPIGLQTQQLIYEIDNSEFGTVEHNTITVASLKLDIPYCEYYLFIFCDRQVASFRLPVGLLPERPGEVDFTAFVYSPQEQTRDRQQNFTAVSYEGTRPHCMDADSANGWKIVTTHTPQPTLVDEHGNRKGADHDWTDSFHSVSEDRMCWNVWLDDEDVQIDFAIHIREIKRWTDTIKKDPVPVELQWNGSVALDAPDTGKWVVRIKPFDGVWQEFPGPGESIPAYFTVGTQNSSILVKAKPPPELP